MGSRQGGTGGVTITIVSKIIEMVTPPVPPCLDPIPLLIVGRIVGSECGTAQWAVGPIPLLVGRQSHSMGSIPLHFPSGALTTFLLTVAHGGLP